MQTEPAVAPTDFSGPNDSTDMRLSRAELEDLRDAFRLFDTEHKGTVNAKELVDILSEMLRDTKHEMHAASSLSNSTRRNLQRLYKATKALPAEAELTQEHFIQLITSSDDHRSDIEKVFHMFSGGKKFITLSDLSQVANELGEDMTQEELEEMLARASPDGHVTLPQFSQIMNKKLFS